MASTVDDTDGGKGRGRAERMCIVSRKTLPIERLMRFVLGPEGAIIPDLKAVLPGRGVWVTARRDDIRLALAQKLFSRAVKR